LGTESLEEVRKNLEPSLAERIAGYQVKREASWTESLAVGSLGFVENFKPADFSRRETRMAAESLHPHFAPIQPGARLLAWGHYGTG
jgi:hypothetical protein